MTHADVQQQIVQALVSVAPEIDPASLNAGLALRDQVDLDSMDFLRFVIALKTQIGVEVPEADYPRLETLAGAVDYLVARLGTRVG